MTSMLTTLVLAFTLLQSPASAYASSDCKTGACTQKIDDATAMIQRKVTIYEQMPKETSAGSTTEPEELDMAKISDMVYDLAPVAGWTIEAKGSVPSKILKLPDYFAIYAKDGICALAFAGTNDVADLDDDFDVREHSGCGVDDWHKGFFEEFEDFMKADLWKNDFIPVLTGAKCSSGIYATGHSLGGALATVFAVCANNDKLGPLHGADLPTLHVAKLYTYGTPSVAKTVVTSTGGSCFGGKRFYNLDAVTYDPIALHMQDFGFLHPKMMGVQLHADMRDRITKKEISCDTSSLYKQPKRQKWYHVPSFNDHKASTYIARVDEMY